MTVATSTPAAETRPRRPGRRSTGRAARTAIRWFIGVIVLAHGLIHLLGAVKGFGWAEVPQLVEPIGTGSGVVWLVAAVLTTATGVLLLARIRWWWILGAAALVTSQLVILTSWTDAGVGTIANLVLLVAVIYGWASQGPRSFRAESGRRSGAALLGLRATGVVTEVDLERLPAPVAAYVRQSGALGRPRVTSFHAQFHGRIRSDATKPWMTFTGDQVNTYGDEPSRLFFMDATMLGIPVDVLHAFVAGTATMRVKACSLLTMVDASGPEMDQAETVTLFNDLCVLAPAALVDAPVTWLVIDDRRARGAYTAGHHTVTAVLTFNEAHELVDFVSDDRLAGSTDGKTFTPQRWSTPISGYRDIGSRRVGTIGEGHWHAPDGEFAYLEFDLDQIAYNPATPNWNQTLVPE